MWIIPSTKRVNSICIEVMHLKVAIHVHLCKLVGLNYAAENLYMGCELSTFTLMLGIVLRPVVMHPTKYLAQLEKFHLNGIDPMKKLHYFVFLGLT